MDDTVPPHTQNSNSLPCPSCKNTLPATNRYFDWQKNGKGWFPECHSCRREKHIIQQRAIRKTQSVINRSHNSNHRARYRGISGRVTSEQIKEQYSRQKAKCYYCQKSIPWGEHHVDHTFPLSRVEGLGIPANDISYLVIACRDCNLSKHDKFPWEFPEGGRLL